MGCGKSTVGAALARRLGWGFRDLDRWIEERHGLTVAEIFRGRGEAFFRGEERRAARAADVTVDSSRAGPDEVAQQIVEAVFPRTAAARRTAKKR